MKKNKILLYVTLFALILNIFNPLIVYAESKGEIRKNSITVGDTKEAGNVKVTKTVTKVDDNGRYRITFDVVGKNGTTTVVNDAKPYIVYIVDSSETMNTLMTTNPDRSRFYYAKQVVRDSSTAFVTAFNSKAMMAVILFDGYSDIDFRRDFNNTAIGTGTWGSGMGNTPTDKAIKKATEILNNVTDATSKHIILLSDGLPYYGTQGDDTPKVNALKEAEKAKENDIEIYSVFIQENKSTDVEAKQLMDNIASQPTNTHSFEAANATDLIDSFNKITTSIINTPAATNAVLKDVIGSDFSYVSSSASSSDIVIDGKNVTINIGDIEENTKSYYFDIQINEDASTGWHETNDSFKLTGEGLKNTVSTTDSAEVYWEETYKKLVIEKELKGISNNNTKFNFEITLKDKEGNLLSGEYKYKLNDGTETTLKFVNGVATINLKHGEKVEFINIPRNTKFIVEEKTRDGYKTQVCINDNNCKNEYKYEGSLTDDINIKFVNTGSEYELPETGSSGGLILIITGLTFTGGAVIYILIDLLRKNRMC